MSANTNLAVAIHALAVLDHLRDGPVPSAAIARSVNTNPVVVRRIMSQLVKAGVVESIVGAHGGFQLTRPSRRVSLREVARAVDGVQVFAVHRNAENRACTVSCGIKPALAQVFGRVDGAVERVLGQMTLADVTAHLE